MRLLFVLQLLYFLVNLFPAPAPCWCNNLGLMTIPRRVLLPVAILARFAPACRGYPLGKTRLTRTRMRLHFRGPANQDALLTRSTSSREAKFHIANHPFGFRYRPARHKGRFHHQKAPFRPRAAAIRTLAKDQFIYDLLLRWRGFDTFSQLKHLGKRPSLTIFLRMRVFISSLIVFQQLKRQLRCVSEHRL